MMEFLHIGADDFLSYIQWRIKMHEKIIAGGELDAAEFFFTGPEYTKDKDYIYIHNNIDNWDPHSLVGVPKVRILLSSLRSIRAGTLPSSVLRE